MKNRTLLLLLVVSFNAPKGWYHFLTATSGGHYNIFFINPPNLGLICHSERNEFSKNTPVARKFSTTARHNWGSTLFSTATCGFTNLHFPSNRWKHIPPPFARNCLSFCHRSNNDYFLFNKLVCTAGFNPAVLSINAPKGWYHFLTRGDPYIQY